MKRLQYLSIFVKGTQLFPFCVFSINFNWFPCQLVNLAGFLLVHISSSEIHFFSHHIIIEINFRFSIVKLTEMPSQNSNNLKRFLINIAFIFIYASCIVWWDLNIRILFSVAIRLSMAPGSLGVKPRCLSSSIKKWQIGNTTYSPLIVFVARKLFKKGYLMYRMWINGSD
jgi:hypothetical protein